MIEIERESFVYERFKNFQQCQVMMRADGHMGSRKSRKTRSFLANVSPSDQPGHEGGLADNCLQTLEAPAKSLNVDKIKKQLQAAEKAHEANAKNITFYVQNFRQVKGMLIH